MDAGNSRLKWLHVQRGSGLQRGYLPTAGLAEAGLVAAWRALPKPGEVVVCSVAGGAVGDAVVAAAKQMWSLPVKTLKTSAVHAGLVCGYPEPSRLGVDRWAAMVGAWLRGHHGFMVADAGSALTIDAVDDRGHHLGGYILPGIGMMRAALLSGTEFGMGLAGDPAASPAIKTGTASGAAVLAPGTETLDAVNHGVLLACVGAVTGALALLSDPAVPVVYLTGGDASVLAPGLREARVNFTEAPDLVFEGMLGMTCAPDEASALREGLG
ncbi:MAG: type III pantothenate kinase [Pseudomonadales bacterium]|nr:type III pantothenate kinase [Pseudomonadales bacterium]